MSRVIRIIECEITIATTAGQQTGVYPLATTLLDHHRYPAFELVKLYHARWEVEMCQPQCTHMCVLAACIRSSPSDVSGRSGSGSVQRSRV